MKTRMIRDDDGWAILIPKEIAFPEDTELTILYVDGVITIYPSSYASAAEALKGSSKAD